MTLACAYAPGFGLASEFISIWVSRVGALSGRNAGRTVLVYDARVGIACWIIPSVILFPTCPGETSRHNQVYISLDA